MVCFVEPSPSSIPVKASTVNRKNGGNKKPAKVPPIPKSHSPVTIDEDALKRGVDANANELPQVRYNNQIRASILRLCLVQGIYWNSIIDTQLHYRSILLSLCA